MAMKRGRDFLEYSLVTSINSGATATSVSVIFQLMVKKKVSVAINSTTQSPIWYTR